MPEEMIDVITPQGVFTGVTKSKSEVHRDGDWHACAHGIVTDGQGKVLTQLRGPEVKLLRNVWDPVCVAGHISAYEGNPAKRDLIQQAIETLMREFDEEVGYYLDLEMFLTEDGPLIGITRTNQRTEDGWMDRTLNLNFLLTLPYFNVRAAELEPGKVLEVAWRHVDEIEEMLEGRSRLKLAVRQPENDRLVRSVIHEVRRTM